MVLHFRRLFGKLKMEKVIIRALGLITALLLFTSARAVSAASCWVSSTPFGPQISTIGDSDFTTQNLYWLNYQGTSTSSLNFKIKFVANSTETIQVQKFKNMPASVTTPLSIPADAANAIHGPAKLLVKDDFGKCTYDFSVVQVKKFEFGGPSLLQDNTTLCTGMTISGINTIAKVRVYVYIQHTFDADLTITLNGPNNNMPSVVLSDRNGGGGQNYGQGIGFGPTFKPTLFDDAAPTLITAGTPPYNGSYMPQSALSAFTGLSGAQANGSWWLCVDDQAVGDTGYLLGGGIEIEDQF